jgi:cbb3-type cytochrome oxidase subunit 3
MGAALIVPIVAILMLAVVWFVYGAKRTRDQAKLDASLPDEPRGRRAAELDQLRTEHAEADPALTQHPARRP